MSGYGPIGGDLTPWNATVSFQYGPQPWMVAYMRLPDPVLFPTAVGVSIHVHGGGWIASSKVNDWRITPDAPLLDELTTDYMLNLGFAVVWIEFSPGWHGTPAARAPMPSRFPQNVLHLARVKQYLHTHAEDGLVTRSRSIKLPTEWWRYGFYAGSAGAIMALWVALQRDGWASFDPTGRAAGAGQYAYTRTHRVGWICALETPVDLRRYQGVTGGGAGALPYFHWPGRLFRDTPANATIGTTDRFATINSEWKGASAATVAASMNYRPNLDVAVMIACGSAPTEASYLDSGVTLNYIESASIGTPTIGATLTAAGGAAGTLVNHDTANRLLHVNHTTGTMAQWTGALSGAATLGSTEYSRIGGIDARPTFLSESALLALWDADQEPLEGCTEHSVAYLPAWKRLRAAQYAANPDATNYDRIYGGFPYVGSTLSSGYTAPAFPWNGLGINEELEVMLTARGLL